MHKITSTYIHRLQAIYNRISNRGICIDTDALKTAKQYCVDEIAKNLIIASNQWNVRVFIGAANDDGTGVNINSTQGKRSFLSKLQELGYEVPKITKKDQEGNYEANYSTSELAIQKMLISNQFNYVGGDPALRAVLKVRELGKLRSAYLNSLLHKSPEGNLLYLSSYNVAGTVTGRRSSKKHTFGYGNNGQNFPKHGTVSEIFRKCLVPRPNNCFLMVDQRSAEEWPVNALANNQKALDELRAGVNRHTKRAIYLFNVDPKETVQANWKDRIEYYLGKKVGHASNYGMRGQRMSDSIVQETGQVIQPKMCQYLLDKQHELEPNIRNVFHAYIKEQLYKTRVLRTPFGRERIFFGLRQNDENYVILNDGYSYIPQSTVGDNTGFAVHYLETSLPLEERAIVQEGHDSITQDVPFNLDELWIYLRETIRGFDRRITFYNGITVQIPIEAEIGFNFAETTKLKELTFDGLKDAYEQLKMNIEAPCVTIT